VVKIGTRLREVRRSRLLTQQMLAQKSGVAQPTIHRLETDKQEPQFRTIHKLAAALGVDPLELVDDEAPS
jgi:transcriptional regulator with XRE-family HTH domain